jgi:hypothetical protein
MNINTSSICERLEQEGCLLGVQMRLGVYAVERVFMFLKGDKRADSRLREPKSATFGGWVVWGRGKGRVWWLPRSRKPI